MCVVLLETLVLACVLAACVRPSGIFGLNPVLVPHARSHNFDKKYFGAYFLRETAVHNHESEHRAIFIAHRYGQYRILRHQHRGRKMRITIKSTCTTPVSLHLFGGWGAVDSQKAVTNRQLREQEALLCAVSGSSVTGEEVIALVDAPPPAAGGSIDARTNMVFDKPRKLSHGAAAQLPWLALTAVAALHSIGLPPGRASVGYDASASAPAKVLVAGGTGRLPSLLVQVLAARGAQPYVASNADQLASMRELGACEAIDHNVDSFCDALGSADAVVDCVGREEESEHLRRGFGAAYISAASPGLLALENDGALQQLTRWRASWGKPRHEGQNIWAADDLAAEAMVEVLALIESGKVAPPEEANGAAELTQQYLEYIQWVRDAETGLRLGFPGESIWPDEPPGLS